MINLQGTVRHYLRKNILFYSICCIALIIGIVIGSLNYIIMPTDEGSYLQEYMGGFFSSMSSHMPSLFSVFKTSFIENTKMLLIMWVFGFSLIGIPLCLFVIGVRGFAFGFAISSFVGVYGWRGVLIALCALFPQMLVYLPALLSAGVTVFDYSLYFSSPGKSDIRGRLLSYSLLVLLFLGIFLLASLLEGYVSPILLKWTSQLVIK